MLFQSAKLIGGALSAIGIAGAGVGIGVVFGSLVLGVARNPSLEERLTKIAILGFALTEATALFLFINYFFIPIWYLIL